jgi:hypothetical protein
METYLNITNCGNAINLLAAEEKSSKKIIKKINPQNEGANFLSLFRPASLTALVHENYRNKPVKIYY